MYVYIYIYIYISTFQITSNNITNYFYRNILLSFATKYQT